MKRFLLLIIISIFVVSCAKDEILILEANDVTLVGGSTSISRVQLSYMQGDQVSIKVAMMEDWYINATSADGEDLDFSI